MTGTSDERFTVCPSSSRHRFEWTHISQRIVTLPFHSRNFGSFVFCCWIHILRLLIWGVFFLQDRYYWLPSRSTQQNKSDLFKNSFFHSVLAASDWFTRKDYFKRVIESVRSTNSKLFQNLIWVNYSPLIWIDDYTCPQSKYLLAWHWQNHLKVYLEIPWSGMELDVLVGSLPMTMIGWLTLQSKTNFPNQFSMMSSHLIWLTATKTAFKRN